MITHEICSNNQFRAMFPDLAVTNKFKRKLDEVFEGGFQFVISKAEGPFRIWNGKNGSKWKFKLTNPSNGKKVLFGKVTNNETHVDREWLKDHPEWKILKDNGGGFGVLVLMQNVRSVQWSDLTSAVSRIIEDDLVEWHNCGKCHGSGKIPAFAHIANGVCFDCMGIGKWIVVTKNKDS